MRYRLLDAYKGILIILVILGHIMPYNLSENLPRNLIYAYHMGLFIGISGFLVDITGRGQSWTALFRKYWKRAIKAWVIAIAIFAAFHIVSTLLRGDSWTVLEVIKYFVRSYLYPGYHLWYISGWLCYIVICMALWRLFADCRHRYIYMWLIVIGISLFGYFWSCDHTVCRTIRHWFQIYNLFFFFEGVCLKAIVMKYKDHIHKHIVKWLGVLAMCSCLMLVAVIYCFYGRVSEGDWFYVCVFFISKAVTVAFFLLLASCSKWNPDLPVLEYIGRNSLPFYLYHELGLRFVELLGIPRDGSVQSYAVSWMAMVCVGVFIVWGNQKPFIRYHFFGGQR